MRFRIALLFAVLPQLIFGSEFSLLPDIEKALRLSDKPTPGVMSREDPVVVDYLIKNWRRIAANIQCLPPIENGSRSMSDREKFNVSVINFGIACDKLPSMEYVEFFEQIVGLYEQKRISLTAFENIYFGGDDKNDFWSVNWEHPRVQAIFARIRTFDPPPDETFRSMVEDQSLGKLADNYMTNESDDSPLPETLPGIKLQRPWASLIRKYETMTGKKVPPDPNFPDHHVTRPSRKGLREMEAGNKVVTSVVAIAKPWWTKPGIVIPLAAGMLLVVLWFRSWMRPA